MDGPSLPRSIRWRLQLGILKSAASLEELYDLNASRLQEQRHRYASLVEQHEANMIAPPTQEEKEEEECSDTTPVADVSLDPLTAMVREQEAQEKRRQELDLKYRKERARRKRGIQEGEATEAHGEDYSSYQTLQIIDKDLHRLQQEHHTYHHCRRKLLQQRDDFDSAVEERTHSLAEILHVLAREHSALGYRQGMHEIASYLLLTIEMDLFDQESSDSQEPCAILNANYMVHDAYTMLETVMKGLSPAYDVRSSPSASSSPMEQMARSVISQLRQVDESLFQAVKAMHCPPELYCTRWIRLMFSREVLGWRNVLLLWDVFMDLISCEPTIRSNDTTGGLGQSTLMQVLETTAASMIVLQRDALLEADPNESIHILMNMEPRNNIAPLTTTLLSLMRQDGSLDNDLSSMATLFGQMARDAFQQIAPAGESLRKLYNTSTASSTSFQASATRNENQSSPVPDHPLSGASPTAHTKERRPMLRGSQRRSEPSTTNPQHMSCAAMSEVLKESTRTMTDFLMELKTKNTSDTVPEAVWEALAQVETVRSQLAHSNNDAP